MVFRRPLPPEVKTLRARAVFILKQFDRTYPPLWEERAAGLSEREADVSGAVEMIVETLEQWSMAQELPTAPSSEFVRSEVSELNSVVASIEPTEQNLVSRMERLLEWIDSING
jgi:hypothetical protein